MAHQPDKGPLMLAVFSVFLALSLFVVLLRIVSRWVSRTSERWLWWDDWLILLAEVLVVVNYVFAYQAIRNDAGKHFQPDQPLDRLESFLLYTYLMACVYAPAAALVKASILCLYLRIFAVDRRFAMTVKCFLAIDAAWAVGTFFAIVFQCIPVQAAWDLSIQHKTCTASESSLIASNVPDIVIDFCIMALPMPMIWRMKLSARRKIGLTVIFALGASASISAIIRLQAITSFSREDPTWNTVSAMLWSLVELKVGIICACGSNLAPLARFCLGKRPTSSPAKSTAVLSKPFRSKQTLIFVMEDGPSSISGKGDSRPDDQALAKKGSELGGIHTTNDIDIERG